MSPAIGVGVGLAFQGPRPQGEGAAPIDGALLLEDGVSYLLLEDGVSKLLLE